MKEKIAYLKIDIKYIKKNQTEAKRLLKWLDKDLPRYRKQIAKAIIMQDSFFSNITGFSLMKNNK